MLQLARAYDVDSNTLRVDAGDICVTTELIGSVFSIPSQVAEPWIDEWTANELDKKAEHVISQGCIVDNARKAKKQKKESSSKAVNEKGRYKRSRKDSDQSPSTQGKTTSQESYKDADKCGKVDGGRKQPRKDSEQAPSIKSWSKPQHRDIDTQKECRLGTRRKLPICRSRSRSGTKKAIPRESVLRSKGAPLDVKQAEPVFNDDHEGAQEENPDHKDASPYTPLAAHVQLTEYDFDHKFDILIVQCLEFEQVLNNVEQGQQTKAIIMQPLQTVLPNKSGYHTPSPGRPSFSLGLTQLEKTPTSSPIHSIHPRLRNIKKGETKEKQIRARILNSSLNKEQDLAYYEGREHMVSQRKDLWTLKARSWVNSCIIQWICYSFNDTESSRFKRDFYCESVTRKDNLASFIDGARPIYDGLSPKFGEKTRFFDKLEAAKRKWWLIHNCWRGHWWVYAFEVNAKRLVIINSLHSAPEDDERDKLDAYVGRLFEDMASIVIPAFVRTTYGPSRSYTRDSLRSYRMELMLDIICGLHNALVHQVLSLLKDKVKPVRCNQPRNKKRKVRSPFTAPSTKSLIERAEGLLKGVMRKGRKK
ncbi:uncharacterized protein DS421_17g583700 [Arachis hypogaea]|nr:uncharacterized protein DS421_17g583700 [Arachis hypogaea]